MIRDIVIFLTLWMDKRKNPPIAIDRSSKFGKMVPKEIERINITIVKAEEKININFGDKTIENAELVKEILANSWKLLESAKLL